VHGTCGTLAINSVETMSVATWLLKMRVFINSQNWVDFTFLIPHLLFSLRCTTVQVDDVKLTEFHKLCAEHYICCGCSKGFS